MSWQADPLNWPVSSMSCINSQCDLILYPNSIVISSLEFIYNYVIYFQMIDVLVKRINLQTGNSNERSFSVPLNFKPVEFIEKQSVISSSSSSSSHPTSEHNLSNLLENLSLDGWFHDVDAISLCDKNICNQDGGLFQQELEYFENSNALNMMIKMGWQPGKGLGKNLQGIKKPIEQQFLKQGQGLGYKSKKKNQQDQLLFATSEPLENQVYNCVADDWSNNNNQISPNCSRFSNNLCDLLVHCSLWHFDHFQRWIGIKNSWNQQNGQELEQEKIGIRNKNRFRIETRNSNLTKVQTVSPNKIRIKTVNENGFRIETYDEKGLKVEIWDCEGYRVEFW